MTLRDHPDMSGPPVATPDDALRSEGAAPSKRQKRAEAKVTPLTVVSPSSTSDRSARRKKKQNEALALLEKLGAAQVNEDEAAEALGVTPESLSKRMTGRTKERLAFEKGRAAGLLALRGAQLKLAETSALMAIFLGRVYLGQSERREVDPRESNEIAEVAQSVRDRLAALVAEANRSRYPYPGGDRRDD